MSSPVANQAGLRHEGRQTQGLPTRLSTRFSTRFSTETRGDCVVVTVLGWIVLGWIMLAWATPLFAQSLSETRAAEEHFVVNVLPVMTSKCFACHGDDVEDLRGGLDMRSLDALKQGGDHGEPAIIPGDADASPIFLAAQRRSDEWSPMPPKENDSLTASQLAHLRKWIADGSIWPDKARQEAIQQELTQPDDSEDRVVVAVRPGTNPTWTHRQYDREQLWAYEPLREDFEARSIDEFLDQRMAVLGVDAAPEADRRTLIRRATFDLTGLPPTPSEIADFLADRRDTATAFAVVVDRLLASPHYGEHWGRHWLDLVRYADSAGYANDFERGNAWRYRDYVIRAFNSDKPYDQFVVEQIAGDELDPDNAEMLVAVGFLRMGPWELTGMEVPKVARQRFLDDITDTVGQVFLGHMLQCARCHDHKFDPVPTQDYYAFQAIFSSTQMADRPAPFLATETLEHFDLKRYDEQRREHYQASLDRLNRVALRHASEAFGTDDARARAFQDAVDAVATRSGKPAEDVNYGEVRKELTKSGWPIDEVPKPNAGFTAQEFGLERIGRKGLQRLAWRMQRYSARALSVYSGRTPQVTQVMSPPTMPQKPLEEGEIEETCVLIGGDPFSSGESVAPAPLSVVGALGDSQLRDWSIPHELVGRRTALAQWIVHDNNPLTPRVIANRLWQHHFGQAIAGNPNNFGATGKRPTHPELLDWLAVQLQSREWSLKAMHRLIMNTRAYRRSAQHPSPQTLSEKDPLGTSYARFQQRRLTAEELRDAILFVSAELNPAVGGLPTRPEINPEVALQPRMVMGTFAEPWQAAPLPSQRHRRSIYTLQLRGLRDPWMEVFNAPSPDLSCEARETSTVTPQVFSLFNSAHSYDRALAFAKRLWDSTRPIDQPSETIRAAFLLALGRAPTSFETQRCLEHWRSMTERHERLRFMPPQYPDTIRREALEENTGERFAYDELLEISPDFVPDFKPHEASPSQRGLAEVCLVLFNSNEFVYVD